MIVIKFKSREDKINGYYLLALKGIVRGLRSELFEANNFMLKYLDEEGIQYEIVKEVCKSLPFLLCYFKSHSGG